VTAARAGGGPVGSREKSPRIIGEARQARRLPGVARQRRRTGRPNRAVSCPARWFGDGPGSMTSTPARPDLIRCVAISCSTSPATISRRRVVLPRRDVGAPWLVPRCFASRGHRGASNDTGLANRSGPRPVQDRAPVPRSPRSSCAPVTPSVRLRAATARSEDSAHGLDI